MIPHVIWLMQVNFAPLTYAGDSYSITDRAMINDLALGYIGHNLALLALPVVLAARRAVLAVAMAECGSWSGRAGPIPA